MIRSTAISFKAGLAIAVLLSWQLPALADDGRPEKTETPPESTEPKTVRVILLPPADKALFAPSGLQTANAPKAGRIVMIRPVDDAGTAAPRAEPAEGRKDASAVEPPSPAEPPERVASLPPADEAAIAAPRAEPEEIQTDATPDEPPSAPEPSARVVSLSPADEAAIPAPQAEPEEIQAKAVPVEPPPAPEPSARVAPPPPAEEAATAEPAEIQKDAAPVEVPSLPERSPMRQALDSREALENQPKALSASFEQTPRPSPVVAKDNSAFRFLSNLWPGKTRAGAPDSPAAKDEHRNVASSASVDADTDSWRAEPSAISASAPRRRNPAETGPASEQPTLKRKLNSFLDSVQFWKD